jgi:hypothetical protein
LGSGEIAKNFVSKVSDADSAAAEAQWFQHRALTGCQLALNAPARLAPDAFGFSFGSIALASAHRAWESCD